MVDLDDRRQPRSKHSAWSRPAQDGRQALPSLAAVVGPVLDSSSNLLHRRTSQRERKSSNVTVRRESPAPSSDRTAPEHTGDTVLVRSVPQSTPRSPALLPLAAAATEDKRRSAGSDASLRNIKTWFTRPRRFSAQSSSSNTAVAPSLPSSPLPSPAPLPASRFDNSMLTAETESDVSTATAGTGTTLFTHSVATAAVTDSSVGVDAASSSRSTTNVRAARAFIVAQLSQLSRQEMGADRHRIDSLASRVEQDSDVRSSGDATTELLDFWTSLSDGVLLCLLANQLHPKCIETIDRRDADWVKADNISRFLRAARDYLGVRSKDLFHPLDLTDATVEGLQRAVHTVLALERSASARGLTGSPASRPSAAIPVPLRSSAAPRILNTQTPPLTPHGSLDEGSELMHSPSDVPFPRGSGFSPRASPAKRPSGGQRHPVALSIQQQRQEAERILVAGNRYAKEERHRRSSDVGAKPQFMRSKGVSITFADSVSRGSDEETRMPYRDRKLSESAISLTGVAEEDLEDLLRSPPRLNTRAVRASDDDDDEDDDELARGNASPRLVGLGHASSPMARASSQRRISQELQHGAGGSPGRPLRTSSDFEEHRFPSGTSPARQAPVRRHSARSYAGPSSLNPHRDGGSSENVAAFPSMSSSPARVPFPRAASAHESPTVKRIGRHLSLNAGMAGYVSSSSSVNLVPASPKSAAARPNYRHMRYASDLQIPRSPHGASSDVSDAPAMSAISSHVSGRSRLESDVGSLYTNTLCSDATRDDGTSSVAAVSGGVRLSRDPSVAPGAKHKLVVVEEGKPNVTYQMGNCIGRGQFGSVYRALNLNSGQMMAVKRIKLEGKSEDEVTQLMNEVDLLKSLAHPSVVKYEGLVRGPDVVSIILEYVENGSLLHTLKAFGNFPEKLVASYVVKILEGLNYLHDMKVVHCDLKAANILTTKNGNVKLSDFGVSLNLKAVEKIQNVKNDAIGTPNWSE
jgi:serine/threonine protein kinase